MSDYTITPNYQLYKPTVDADADAWGGHLNANTDRLDGLISSLTQGNLVYTATGGNTPRAAQDRAADVANVLDFGADPTGVADSSAAINAAAAIVSAGSTRHKAVYLPTGTYRVNNQITLTAAQCMFGDSRGSSVLLVDQAFNSSATSVILCTAAFYDTGPVLRDFGITFTQPTTQGVRANFKTLAAGGTNATGIAYPWAIASGSDSMRVQIIRVRIAGAWDGITTNGHNTVFWLEDIEIGALDIGVNVGDGPGVQDFMHINQYHFWNFGFSGVTYSGVYNDGQTISLQIGRCDGINIKDFCSFCARLVFTGDGGFTACHITNCMMDSDTAAIEINGTGIGHLFISNMYGSAGTSRVRPLISANAGGHVRISNLYSHSSSNFPEILVNSGGADVAITNFHNYYYTLNSNWATIIRGTLRLTNGYLAAIGGAHTAPLIQETTNGSLVIDNVQIDGGGGGGFGGVAIQMVTASPGTMIGKIAFAPAGPVWTFSLPATLNVTTYSPTVSFGSIFTSGFVQSGSATAGNVGHLLVAAAGGQKALQFFRGATNAWALVSSGATDDFQILRYNDSGTFLGAPFAINRATATISLAALQASTTYANDAAASAGGVPVGGLYRNGSVVQVRVT